MTSSRISYRCLADERTLPVAERTHWDVRYNNKNIGYIKVKDDHTLTNNRSHSVRVWQAHLTKGFNPFEFPHAEDGEVTNEPFIITNDDMQIDHNLELRNPQMMTMKEARSWVANTYKN